MIDGAAATAGVLAHAGAGASWQSLVTTISLGLVGVLVLAVLGQIRLEDTDDLVLPVAVVAILSAAAPTIAGVLSDHVGWALPLGVVALAALVAATYTDLQLSVRAPLTWGAVVVAVVAAVVLHGPLTRAWHPPEQTGAAPEATPTPTPPATTGGVGGGG